jgi:hypothetical protein
MIHAYVATKPHIWSLAGAMLLALFGFYVLAFDQGALLSVFQGPRAYDLNFIHELVHDARHAAGFPCH